MTFYNSIRIFSLLLVFSILNVRADVSEAQLNVTCIGNDNAQGFLIYLHGMDSIIPSPQELTNRKILTDIALKYNLKIAMPRAEMECPTQLESICWGWTWSSLELTTIIPKILSAREQCFSSDKPFGVIGFSNGGYLLNNWFQAGLLPSFGINPSFIISSGADRGFILSNSIDLSKNPPLILIAGDHDIYNHDMSETYSAQLMTMHADVKVVTFNGAHELNEDVLTTALKYFYH